MVFAIDTDGDNIDDLLDVCNNTPLGILVDSVGRPRSDLDGDCDVDLMDFSIFEFVTLEDFALFELTGPFPSPIDIVSVYNADNPSDHNGYGYGGVNYIYNIGKFEITSKQYVDFLNAVAKNDTYGLYNPEMFSNAFGCKIERLGVAGDYTYAVAEDWAKRPVNYVTWGDAIRYCNWLHNGRPIGNQDLSTTEDGSYLLNGALTNKELLAIMRKPDATWVIPTEDEWYKAAYHKNDGVTGNYFKYPTSSDIIPSNDLIDPDPGNNATFYDGIEDCDIVTGECTFTPGDYTIGSPYYRTEVGSHENSSSPYGTFDQGGNLWEWNETMIRNIYRGVRGESFYYVHDALNSSIRQTLPPTHESYNVGFRVAEIP